MTKGSVSIVESKGCFMVVKRGSRVVGKVDCSGSIYYCTTA